MDAYCIPRPGATKQHRDFGICNASQQEISSLIVAVRMAPAETRLPEATLLDIVKRHAEHRMAVKHGGNVRQAMLKVIWAQVHQTLDQKQVKKGVKTADTIRSLGVHGPSVPEATYLLYLSAVGKFNLGEFGEARKRALQVLNVERDHTRAAILIYLIQSRVRKRPLGWWPWHKKCHGRNLREHIHGQYVATMKPHLACSEILAGMLPEAPRGGIEDGNGGSTSSLSKIY